MEQALPLCSTVTTAQFSQCEHVGRDLCNLPLVCLFSGALLGHSERLRLWELEVSTLWGYSKCYNGNFPKQ